MIGSEVQLFTISDNVKLVMINLELEIEIKAPFEVL